MGLAFGGAQAIAPLLGFAAGAAFAGLIESFDHWLAFAILSVLGAKMIKEGLTEGPPDAPPKTPAVGWALAGLAVATSIDAAAAGVALPAMGLAPIPTAAIVGAITFAVCFLGVRLGRRVGAALGGKAELVGGLALIGLGLKTLFDHGVWA